MGKEKQITHNYTRHELFKFLISGGVGLIIMGILGLTTEGDKVVLVSSSLSVVLFGMSIRLIQKILRKEYKNG